MHFAIRCSWSPANRSIITISVRSTTTTATTIPTRIHTRSPTPTNTATLTATLDNAQASLEVDASNPPPPTKPRITIHDSSNVEGNSDRFDAVRRYACSM